jgi:hypothetical protein
LPKCNSGEEEGGGRSGTALDSDDRVFINFDVDVHINIHIIEKRRGVIYELDFRVKMNLAIDFSFIFVSLSPSAVAGLEDLRFSSVPATQLYPTSKYPVFQTSEK